MHLKRTTSLNTDFINLVKQLDAELAVVDGDDHDFYHQFNGIEDLKHVVVAYSGDFAVGCGAVKPLSDLSMEVKRMFVPKENRKQGIASEVLRELEIWSKELGFSTCRLETGKKQEAANQLYLSKGYNIIPNYGQYAGVENSICFEKEL